MSDVKFSQNGGGDETKVTFISGNQKSISEQDKGCCYKRQTAHCCWVTLALGCLVLIAGVVTLICGNSVLTSVILKTMALKPDSDRLQSWLTPPVQPHLEGYAFSVLNPEEVVQGAKPKLKEVGPFVYKAVTVKDSVNYSSGNTNLQYDDNGETLTYRPRKFYFIDLEKSVGDPDNTIITVPNIPFLTGMSKIRDLGWTKAAGARVVQTTGLGTPFINVSFSGLLWGYNDELPCREHALPDECVVEDKVKIFGDDDDGNWDEDDDWGDDDDWKRRKREVDSRYKRSAQKGAEEKVDLRTLDHDKITKAKAAIVDCKCEWGLFRDRNVTLRKAVTINHGMSELSRKGWVSKFDGSPELKWWAPGSDCDKVGGQDGGTLYPGTSRTDTIQMFISLMCRKIGLKYEKDVEYGHLNSLRFIPPPNALGSADDTDPAMKNEDNKCYCMKDQGFDCFKSGVLNMAPCKVTDSLPKGAPIALSYPHFYQADPHYLNAVEGLKPQKEKHEFYVDISPEFGFPLAIRPRFQLNVVIKRDEDIDIMSKFPAELVLPFLWAQDGFSAPSEEMSAAIKMGLEAPGKISLLGGVALIVLGGGLILAALVWLLVTRRNSSGLTFPSSRR